MPRVLLADDDASARDLVRRALEKDGHNVTSASTGTEALEAFEAARGGYDLVISDVQMPGIDGIALAEAIARLKGGAAVILVSGHAEALERARTLSGLRLQLLAKPFTLEALRSSVRLVLSK